MAEFLQLHWLALFLLLGGAGLGLWGLVRGGVSLQLLLGATFLLLAIGQFTPLADEWALGIIFTACGLLAIMAVVVVVSGKWSAYLGYGFGALLLFGLGCWGLQTVTAALNVVGRFLLSLEVAEPWWLLGLLLVPVLIFVSYRRLASLGPIRRWLALALRCLLVALICLALAEIHARQPDRDVTVLFLWDRSLSIPDQEVKSERWNTIVDFINNAVEKRGSERTGDRTGLIVFGRWPRLELPPAKIPRLNIQRVRSDIDGNYTDISAALKLALASFPEGAGKRIVLISDGNENLGNAVEQARIAKQNGVRIDVVALAAHRSKINEVLVERIEAPPVTDKDTRVTLRIVLRSYHPEVVVGTLTIIKTSVLGQKLGELPHLGLDQAKPEPVLAQEVKLRQGLNVFMYQQPGLHENEAFTYEATFVPTRVETKTGGFVCDGLPGDFVQNNRAATTVLIRGQRAVLLIERNNEHKLFTDCLTQKGLKVVSVSPENLPKAPDELAKILTMFDCVIIANVPADDISDVQQSVLRSNVSEQGAGLVMIGGPDGFGQGGWQDSELEKALPVTCDLKNKRVEGKNGLVLIMHASEMADGNAWQRKIAKLAIKNLSPVDMVGVLYYGGDWNAGDVGHIWHIPFDIVGKRDRLYKMLDSLNPGDMPDVDPALRKARAALTKPEYELSTKHIIFISDGDHWNANYNLLKLLGKDHITLTTVCITTHGAAEIQKMQAMAQAVRFEAGGVMQKGRSYHVTNPNQLPSIYIKESRLVSKSYVFQKQFQPVLRREEGPTKGLPPLPPLGGFVRTSRRHNAFVEETISSPRIDDDDYPLLAYWQYGLGKVVAFTSDCRTTEEGKKGWDAQWAHSPLYEPFWRQAVEWVLRSVNTSDYLTVTTEQHGGKIRVIVDALDKKDRNRRPLIGVKFQAGLTALSAQEKEAVKIDLKLEEKAPGRYEGDFQADEVGSYFLNVKGSWREGDKQMQESARAGVTVPYSPEFAEVESNPALLRELANITDGKYYEEDADVLMQAAKSGEIFRPVASSQFSLQSLWYYLVMLTGILLFFDVAVRRISIEPAQVTTSVVRFWDRLRGRAVSEKPKDVFLERLKSRKAQSVETVEKEKSARRFEPTEGAAAPPAPSAGDMPTTPPLPGPPKTSVAPDKEAEAADYASRLMRAKKRAQEDRDKK